jgi:hypothetical protein
MSSILHSLHQHRRLSPDLKHALLRLLSQLAVCPIHRLRGLQ